MIFPYKRSILGTPPGPEAPCSGSPTGEGHTREAVLEAQRPATGDVSA